MFATMHQIGHLAKLPNAGMLVMAMVGIHMMMATQPMLSQIDFPTLISSPWVGTFMASASALLDVSAANFCFLACLND